MIVLQYSDTIFNLLNHRQDQAYKSLDRSGEVNALRDLGINRL